MARNQPLRAGDTLQILARAIVAGNLIWYAVPKIGDPVVFLKAIHEYGILPEEPAWPLNAAATLIPWMELLGGLLMIAGVMRRGTAAVLGGLLAVFTAAIVIRTQGIQTEEGASFCDIVFDCGCGSGEVLICEKLVYNGLLIACCAYLVFARSNRASLGRGTGLN